MAELPSRRLHSQVGSCSSINDFAMHLLRRATSFWPFVSSPLGFRGAPMNALHAPSPLLPLAPLSAGNARDDPVAPV
eukprot:470039-Pyramimonas_sp.AAC.1